MIVAAAVKYGDLITFLPAPARHHDVLRAFLANGIRKPGSYDRETQGFVTDNAVFLGRADAMRHALECGQPLLRHLNPTGYQGPDLYSEDLW